MRRIVWLTLEELKTISACLNNERLLYEDIKKEYLEMYEDICKTEETINKNIEEWRFN